MIMSIADTLRADEKIDLDQFLEINEIMANRLHAGITAIILRRCLEDGQELDDVEDLVREICSFVMGIRDEIAQDIDYSLPKLPL